MTKITNAAFFFLAAGLFTSVTILAAYQILFSIPLVLGMYCTLEWGILLSFFHGIHIVRFGVVAFIVLLLLGLIYLFALGADKSHFLTHNGSASDQTKKSHWLTGIIDVKEGFKGDLLIVASMIFFSCFLFSVWIVNVKSS